jgi:class 3 adenylate cyclase
VSDVAAEEPLGYLVVDAPGRQQLRVPIFDQLFVGRECTGIAAQRRMVLDDPQISRTHLEIRLDSDTDRAFVIDTSTNGTRLNRMRLERAVAMPITSGDMMFIGDLTLRFEGDRFASASEVDPRLTRARIDRAPMVMVVGDIVDYSTISEITDPSVIASSLNLLWQELSQILRAHQGTLNHYAGDALYAVWELGAVPDAMQSAVAFALAANQRVEELGPQLPLRDPQGSPIRMGWAVVQGEAALASMTRSVEAVIGDSTNVAFRLAGLAGRGGHAAVMVTRAVHDAVCGEFTWGEAAQVLLKGRQGLETVYPVNPSAPPSPVAGTDAAAPANRTSPATG